MVMMIDAYINSILQMLFDKTHGVTEVTRELSSDQKSIKILLTSRSLNIEATFTGTFCESMAYHWILDNQKYLKL